MQTLGDFPVEKLFGEVVLVRFESGVLLRGGSNVGDESLEKAVCTINYLCGAGCKVLLASSWEKDSNGNCLSTQFVAGKFVVHSYIFYACTCWKNLSCWSNCRDFVIELVCLIHSFLLV